MTKQKFEMICEKCGAWFDITCEDGNTKIHKCAACGHENLSDGKKKPKEKLSSS